MLGILPEQLKWGSEDEGELDPWDPPKSFVQIIQDYAEEYVDPITTLRMRSVQRRHIADLFEGIAKTPHVAPYRAEMLLCLANVLRTDYDTLLCWLGSVSDPAIAKGEADLRSRRCRCALPKCWGRASDGDAQYDRNLPDKQRGNVFGAKMRFVRDTSFSTSLRRLKLKWKRRSRRSSPGC